MDVRRRRALLILMAAYAAKKKSRGKRLVWCKPWLTRRHNLGSFVQIFNELVSENLSYLESYIRMPVATFLYISDKIKSKIERQNTMMRDAISPGAQLEAVLIFLASGQSYSRLQYTTRISPSSLSRIIPETCQAIYIVLKEEFLKVICKFYVLINSCQSCRRYNFYE